MEDQLKNILKNHESFAALNDFERTQLVEWCADEQEFQSLKKLFQHVDVWSDQPTDETNTKLRLDQLFAIQYASKQSSSGGREIRFSKNRFSRVAAWTSIPAVAAALVLTWYNYQPEPETTLAKNQAKIKSEVKQEKQETVKVISEQATEVVQESTLASVASSETRQELVTVVVPDEEMSASNYDIEMSAPTVSWSSSLANGSSATLSATNLGATSYTWSANDLSEVKVMSSKMASTEKISSRKKQADAFTSFSVKSMPEMLDVIVAAY
jgi:hypothetical protein